MTSQRTFILIFVLFLPANFVFAGDLQEVSGKNGKEQSWEKARRKAMDEEFSRLILLREKKMDEELGRFTARREEKMDEALRELSFGKKGGKIIFPRSAWYVAKNQARKNAGGANKFFNLQNNRNALSTYFESETEERKIASSAIPSRRKRMLFEESLETDFKGSFYHPNLAAFDIKLENGLRQTKENFQPNLTGKLVNSNLNQFQISSSFLNKKPYAFTLSAEKSREVENHEFFERQVIDSDKYGGNFGHRNPVIPADFSFSNSKKVISRLTKPSEVFDDEEASFSLSNDSNILGAAYFDVVQNKFSRTESGFAGQNGVLRDYSLTSRKDLFGDEKKQFNSFFRFYDMTGTTKNSILNVNENLSVSHSEDLDSSYAYSFSDKSSSEVKIRDNRVSASLRHRLYESLASSFSPYYFNSDGSSFSQDSYGVSLNEEYVKKLGKIGRISSGAGLAYSQEKRKSADNLIYVIGEPHTLATGMLVFLDKPRADPATVAVTDTTGTVTYVLNTDYLLSIIGERAQIQRIPGGGISDGQAVKVDYQAKSARLLEFNTLGENYHSRMDFLNDLLGIFYRLNKESHPDISGGEDFVAQTVNDRTIGGDLRYKNLSVELSRENYDSNLSPYIQDRVKESFFFNPSEKSTLTFDSSQCKVNLTAAQEIQKFFDIVSRYSLGLNSYSRVNAELGFRWQSGTGIDLNDMAGGLGYALDLRKFKFDLKYEFKKQLYLSDSLVNHFFTFRAKREF